MSLPPQKYKFAGIGKFSAIVIMRVLAANPSTAALTIGIPGKITYWVLKKVTSYFASYGVVMGNIGIERVEEMIEKGKFDDSLSDEVFSKIASGVTPEEGQAIDQRVRDAFDQFVTFGKLRDGGDS